MFIYIEALGGILTRLFKSENPCWNPFVDSADPNPNFLAITVDLGLTQYAQYNLTKNPKNLKKPGRPLLNYALAPGIALDWKHLEVLYRREIDLDLVKYLLSQGADPNQNVPSGGTVMSQWVGGWHERREMLLEADRETIFKAAKLLIEHRGQMKLEDLNLLGMDLRPEQMEELKTIAANHPASKNWARWFLRFWPP
jgi:hypothetical protein